MSRKGNYVRRGYSMSRRGRIALLYNEFPVGYFMHLFGLREEITKSLLIYMGVHHTSEKALLTEFYRLPDKNDPNELSNIYDAFHSIGADQQKFVEVMSQHLQNQIGTQKKKSSKQSNPRKKRKRNYAGKRKRSGRRKNKIIERW